MHTETHNMYFLIAEQEFWGWIQCFWRTSAFSPWLVATELGNTFLSLQLRNLEVRAPCAPGPSWHQDTCVFTLGPKGYQRVSRKDSEQAPARDSSPKSPTHRCFGVYHTSVWKIRPAFMGSPIGVMHG